MTVSLSSLVHLSVYPLFSNGPDGVGRWQSATFLLHVDVILPRTSIGLVRSNTALLSLVDTFRVQYLIRIRRSRRRCRRDAQPSSSLMSRGWPWPALSRRWPALIAVAVEGMASPHGRRSRGDRHALREWTSQQVLTETHCAVPPIRSDFPDYGPNSEFF